MGQSYWIGRILGTGDDPFMGLAFAMEVLEIHVVVRQHRPLLGDSIRKYFRVRIALSCPSGVMNG